MKEARKRASLSQSQLASRAATTQSAIARVERGATSPSLERLTRLIRACGFDLQVRIAPLDEQEWTVVEGNQRLTPSQRVAKMVAVARFAGAGREALSETGGR